MRKGRSDGTYGIIHFLLACGGQLIPHTLPTYAAMANECTARQAGTKKHGRFLHSRHTQQLFFWYPLAGL